MISEPPAAAAARKARMQGPFPHLALADAGTVLGIDGMNAARGGTVTPFGQTAMRLAAHAAKRQNPPSMPAASPAAGVSTVLGAVAAPASPSVQAVVPASAIGAP